MLQYNEQLCHERHKHIDAWLEVQDKRLNNHSDDIELLQKTSSTMEVLMYKAVSCT